MKITASIIPSKSDSVSDFSLSVSKAKTFESCKAKYYYTYIKKFPRKEWDFFAFGSFLHEVLENFHRSLIENPEQESSLLMTKIFKQSLSNWKDKLAHEQKIEGWKIIGKYLEKDFPNILAVEKNFYIDLDGKILLNGFIDIVQKDNDGIIHVADYKTTKNKKYLKDYFQLLTYAFVLMLEDPSMQKIRASYVLLRHNFEYITKEYTRDEVMKVAEKFVQYAADIEDEKLWRPNPQFLCKYCDHLERCSDGTDYLVSRRIIQSSNFGAIEW